MDRAAEVVLKVATNVLGELDLETVLDRVLDGARELTGARYAAVGVLQEGPSSSAIGLERFITIGLDERQRQNIGAPPRGRGVLGELIRDPKPLRLRDVGAHPNSYGFPDGHPPMHSFLGAPVLVDGHPYGNLYLTEKEGGEEFTDDDEVAAIMLARLAGVAIENAGVYTAVKRRREELERTVAALEVTTQISRAVGGQTNLDPILELVAKRGRAVVDARALLIELRDEDELVVAAGAGELPESLLGRRVALAGTVAEHALRTHSTQRLSDDLNRARYEEHGLGVLGVEASDGLVVPLVFKDRTYGVLLAVDRLRGGPKFSPEDVRLLEAFAASAATAVATARAVAADLQRLAAVVESSSDAIVTADLEGVLTSWNRGAEQLYGFSAEEMIGSTGEAMLPPDCAHERAILDQVVGGAVVKRIETSRLCKDGSLVEVSLSVSAIRDVDGRIVGLASIARDLTEQKHLERVLSQTRRLESLGQLAGGIAHDMNNLLGIIINSADFALDALAEAPGSQDVREARAAAQRATALVRQLLQFAREETATAEELDVGAIVAELQPMLARTIGTHIALSSELADSSWTVEADRAQIDQVVMNLAVNARDAMPDGGSLVISTSDVDLRRDPDALRRAPRDSRPTAASEYVRLRVRDTGTGMPPDVVARAFEPFFTTKPPGSGTGLGLATVYGIVVKAGGYMDVSSELGKGTVIDAYWPVAGHALASAPASASSPATVPVLAEAPAPSAKAHAQTTILLVDDEDALRGIAERILRGAGYEVLAAALPAEALELAGTDARIDLLLTDLVMPEMPGSKLAERILERRPELPVVYMSGYVARPGDLPDGAMFVTKPFGRAELLAVVAAGLAPGVAEQAGSG